MLRLLPARLQVFKNSVMFVICIPAFWDAAKSRLVVHRQLGAPVHHFPDPGLLVKRLGPWLALAGRADS